MIEMRDMEAVREFGGGWVSSGSMKLTTETAQLIFFKGALSFGLSDGR